MKVISQGLPPLLHWMCKGNFRPWWFCRPWKTNTAVWLRKGGETLPCPAVQNYGGCRHNKRRWSQWFHTPIQVCWRSLKKTVLHEGFSWTPRSQINDSTERILRSCQEWNNLSMWQFNIQPSTHSTSCWNENWNNTSITLSSFVRRKRKRRKFVGCQNVGFWDDKRRADKHLGNMRKAILMNTKRNV
jgi:hypothetical protein